MKQFMIYAKEYMSLGESNQDDEHKKFVAIPAGDLKTGVFSASSHPELSREPIGQTEAKDAADAVRLFEEKRANAMM